MASDEFDIIRRHFNRAALAFPRDGVALGIGDDCALLTPPTGQQLAMSMDMVLEGVHFLPGTDPYLLGRRILLVNLSDLAAMGAEPWCFTLGVSLPRCDEEWLERFTAGLADVASVHRCPLVGGDTTATPPQCGAMAFCIQVHGLVPEGGALRRDGAMAGDLVYVTGTLGDAAAGLRVLQQGHGELAAAHRQSLIDAFHAPESRVNTGLALRGLASAAIDLSDGLASDVGHILRCSGVGATVDIEALPLSEAFRAFVAPAEYMALAAGGGDDYELCFTVPPVHCSRMESMLAALGVSCHRIGRIDSGSGLRWLLNGRPHEVEVRGYNHFPDAGAT